MNKSNQLISISNFTKSGLSAIADNILQPILNGDVDALQIQRDVSAMEVVLKDLKSRTEFRDAVITEVERHGKAATFGGATMTVKETGVRYDFSGCGHPELDAINQKIEALSARKKSIEEMLKRLDGKMTIVDEATGEVCEVWPPAKSSTTTVAVSFKKA